MSRLHRIDLKVPMERQLGALKDLQADGKIKSAAVEPNSSDLTVGIAKDETISQETATRGSNTGGSACLKPLRWLP